MNVLLFTTLAVVRGHNPLEPTMSGEDKIWFLGTVALVVAGIYLLPTVIAFLRDHPQKLGIFLVNLVTGWSIIGYVLTLIWAFRNPESPVTIIQQLPGGGAHPPPIPPRPSLEQELAVLESLRTRGLVTEDEYHLRRQRLLATVV